MNSGLLFPFITIFLPFSLVWGVHPHTFVPVSNATCQPEYAWMNNAEQRSPCLSVAYVIAACVGDTWTQPALPSGYSYNSPNGTTATPCYCSWSCYNLMMACTLCQNLAYTSEITTWPSFSLNCPSTYKDQMFPQGYVLADNTSIPYWATINPTTWPSELFDIGQAENYANQNETDYWPSSPSPNSNSSSSGSGSNTGAIIGGAVGGAVGLLLVLIGGYFLYKHWRHRRLRIGETPVLHTGTPMTNMGAHWSSNPSTLLSPMPTPVNSPPPMLHTTSQPQRIGSGSTLPSPTIHSSFQVASSPPTETASFQTTANTATQRIRAIPII